MSSDTKVLRDALRLIAEQCGRDGLGKLYEDAADAIEALEGEVRVAAITVNGWIKAHEKAEARAERLRVALEKIGEGTRDGQHCALIANTALEDDKTIRAAAGGEG